MSRYDEAVEVIRISKEVKNAAGFTIIPETGIVKSLDDGSSQGDRFIGFVFKGELIADDIVKMKLEEFLNEALMQVSSSILEKIQSQANAWQRHFKNLAVNEAKTVLSDYGE